MTGAQKNFHVFGKIASAIKAATGPTETPDRVSWNASVTPIYPDTTPNGMMRIMNTHG